MGVLCFWCREDSEGNPGLCRLLQLSRPTRASGHYLCPVLSDSAAHLQRETHTFRLLPEGYGHTGQAVTLLRAREEAAVYGAYLGPGRKGMGGVIFFAHLEFVTPQLAPEAAGFE